MRNLLLALALLLTACGPHGPINWPGLFQCAPGISDLVGVVSRILIADGPADQTDMSTRGKRELEDLARTHGPSTVACVVERVVRDWNAPGAAQEPLRLAAAARGQAFLDQVGTHPQLDDAPLENPW
jgi:hypothetical protein